MHGFSMFKNPIPLNSQQHKTLMAKYSVKKTPTFVSTSLNEILTCGSNDDGEEDIPL
jgi:hypothetical protein